MSPARYAVITVSARPDEGGDNALSFFSTYEVAHAHAQRIARDTERHAYVCDVLARFYHTHRGEVIGK